MILATDTFFFIIHNFLLRNLPLFQHICIFSSEYLSLYEFIFLFSIFSLQFITPLKILFFFRCIFHCRSLCLHIILRYSRLFLLPRVATSPCTWFLCSDYFWWRLMMYLPKKKRFSFLVKLFKAKLTKRKSFSSNQSFCYNCSYFSIGNSIIPPGCSRLLHNIFSLYSRSNSFFFRSILSLLNILPIPSVSLFHVLILSYQIFLPVLNYLLYQEYSSFLTCMPSAYFYTLHFCFPSMLPFTEPLQYFLLT